MKLIQEPNKLQLGRLLKLKRLELGLSRPDVEDRIGISINAVTTIEHGTYFPSLTNFWLLCQFYKLDPEWVLEQVSK